MAKRERRAWLMHSSDPALTSNCQHETSECEFNTAIDGVTNLHRKGCSKLFTMGTKRVVPKKDTALRHMSSLLIVPTSCFCSTSSQTMGADTIRIQTPTPATEIQNMISKDKDWKCKLNMLPSVLIADNREDDAAVTSLLTETSNRIQIWNVSLMIEPMASVFARLKCSVNEPSTIFKLQGSRDAR